VKKYSCGIFFTTRGFVTCKDLRVLKGVIGLSSSYGNVLVDWKHPASFGIY